MVNATQTGLVARASQLPGWGNHVPVSKCRRGTCLSFIGGSLFLGNDLETVVGVDHLSGSCMTDRFVVYTESIRDLRIAIPAGCDPFHVVALVISCFRKNVWGMQVVGDRRAWGTWPCVPRVAGSAIGSCHCGSQRGSSAARATSLEETAMMNQ